MKTTSGDYVSTIEDIDPDPIGEPDWTIYADCLDCAAIWRGEWDEDLEAIRFRVDTHVQDTGHLVKWADAEQEFYGREPIVISRD